MCVCNLFVGVRTGLVGSGGLLDRRPTLSYARVCRVPFVVCARTVSPSQPLPSANQRACGVQQRCCQPQPRVRHKARPHRSNPEQSCATAVVPGRPSPPSYAHFLFHTTTPPAPINMRPAAPGWEARRRSPDDPPVARWHLITHTLAMTITCSARPMVASIMSPPPSAKKLRMSRPGVCPLRLRTARSLLGQRVARAPPEVRQGAHAIPPPPVQVGPCSASAPSGPKPDRGLCGRRWLQTFFSATPGTLCPLQLGSMLSSQRG